MMEGKINLHFSNKQECGSVRVRLKFDIPDELMDMLLTDISEAVDKWQDKIIATGYLK